MASYTIHTCVSDPASNRYGVSGGDLAKVNTASGKKLLSELGGCDKASVTMNGPVTDADVLLTARHGGVAGDNVRVRFLGGGVLGVTADGADVTVQLGGATAAQVSDAINADEVASDLVTAVSGGAGSGIPVALGYTSLQGGADNGDQFLAGLVTVRVATNDVGV